MLRCLGASLSQKKTRDLNRKRRSGPFPVPVPGKEATRLSNVGDQGMLRGQVYASVCCAVFSVSSVFFPREYFEEGG